MKNGCLNSLSAGEWVVDDFANGDNSQAVVSIAFRLGSGW